MRATRTERTAQMRVATDTLRRAWRYARIHGLLEGACRGLERCRVVDVCHSLDLFVRELGTLGLSSGNAGATAWSLGGQLAIREILQDEWQDVSCAEGLPARAWMDEQFARNSRLFGALESHTLVATNWVNAQVADLSYINRPHVALPAGMAYAYGARVAAPYRDRGIGSCVKQHLLNVLRQEGIEVVVIAALMRNLAGKRWHLANGFQPWGRAIYLQWCGQDIWWNHLTRMGRRYPDLLGHVEQSHPSPVPLGAR